MGPPPPLELRTAEIVVPEAPLDESPELERDQHANAGVVNSPVIGIRVIFARFWPATRPVRVQWVLTLILVALAPALSASAIWMFKILIDRVVVPHDFRLFPSLAALYTGIALAQGAVSFADEYLSTWVGEQFVLNLRARLFDHLHRLAPGFFERRPLGDLLSRVTGDIGAIEELVLSGIAQALTYAFQLIWFTGALFYLNWRLALAALLAAPAFLAATRLFSRRIKVASRERRRRAGSINAVAEESLSNAALVRAYDHREAENARFAVQARGSFAAQMAATRLQALFGPLTDLLEVAGVLLVIGLAVWELAHGRLSIGGLLAFVAYLTQLYNPVQGAGRLINSLYAASASAERVIELLDEDPTVTDPAEPTPLPAAAGAVQFRAVTYRYPGATEPALTGVDFAIGAGERITVVGASGGGKSTLVKLLLRFDDPESGAVTIDSIDLRKLTASDLYRNVAAVLQETLVFDATVADNIRWGKPEATDSEVIAAAQAADADAFIRALPQGYDTRVGQRGRLLSGGQRQRVAIARAMIRDAPILLLDEPTTGLDAQAAHRILAPMRRLMDGRTTFIISHDLLTVADADRILFLENGRVTGFGRHTDLVVSNPQYERLYALHQRGNSQPAPHDTENRPARHNRVPKTAVAPQLGVTDDGLGARNGYLAADHVFHRYPGQRAAVIENLSFTVAPGRCLTVLGGSGSGKTTLLRLLAGLQQPTLGTIERGPGADSDSGHSRVALVASELHLPGRSIADHIRAHRPDATDAQVVESARQAGAHQLIEDLPDGYGTPIGAASAPASRCLTTRIALAVALLQRPEILLLDEPTAGLFGNARTDMLGTLCAITVGRITVIATGDPLVASVGDQCLRLDTTTSPRSLTAGKCLLPTL